MYCNFCGRNFEPPEGFEEVHKHGNYLVRCEACALEQREEEYDWKEESYGRSNPSEPIEKL
jgi:ribosomal protein L24E